MAVPQFIESWSALYSGSAALRSVVNFAHLGGLIGGGGCAIAADRAMLKAFSRGVDERRRELTAVAGTHAVVLFGLTLVLVSGFLLMFADLESYLVSPVFWVKMGLIALLLGNGLMIRRAERSAALGHDRGWLALRRTAVLSLTLWLTTTLAGVVLPNAL